MIMVQILVTLTAVMVIMVMMVMMEVGYPEVRGRCFCHNAKGMKGCKNRTFEKTW